MPKAKAVRDGWDISETETYFVCNHVASGTVVLVQDEEDIDTVITAALVIG